MRLVRLYLALSRLAVARWHRRQHEAHLDAVQRYLQGLPDET